MVMQSHLRTLVGANMLNPLESAVIQGQVAETKRLLRKKHTFRLLPIAEPLASGLLNQWKLHGHLYTLKHFNQFIALHQIFLRRRELVDTCARLAIIKGEIKALHYLLQFDMDINQADADGNTLLHLATTYKQFELVDLLIAYDACPDLNNDAGLLPFDIALQNEQGDIVHLLLEHSSKTHLQSIERCIEYDHLQTLLKLLKSELTLVDDAIKLAIQHDKPQALFLLLNTFQTDLRHLLDSSTPIGLQCLQIIHTCQSVHAMQE